ncbi:MAG: polysaccharide pyruvyl transferase family protein [Lachnospiraceae bacterium]|nr:polysaccharide pyruvyl transferase family protein [Lachnospiraceae bacterium]
MNIGLFGATGSYDFGDFAMMIRNIEDLYNVNKDNSFYVFSINPRITEVCLKENISNKKLIDRIEIVDDNLINMNIFKKGIRKILTPDKFYSKVYSELYEQSKDGKFANFPADFIKKIKELDICVFNGGGYFQRGWKYYNIKFCAEIQIINRYHIPIYFLSCSIGPMYEYDKYTRESLQYVKSIMIRDGKNYTYKLLHSYGIDRIINGPDDLFTLCDIKFESESDDYVVIEIMKWMDKHEKGVDYIIAELTKFIRFIIKDEKFDVYLVNLDVEDYDGISYMEHLFEKIDDRKHVRMIKTVNIEEIKRIYSAAKYSLSFKYHPIIFSLGAGIPSSAIVTDDDGYYHSKMYGAYENCDMDPNNHVIELNEFSFDVLVSLYKKSNERCSDEVKCKFLNIRNSYLDSIVNNVNFAK